MLYKNFLKIMEDEKVTFKEIGMLLSCRYQTVSDKVNGIVECGFTCDEALLIKKKLFPQYDFNYLFERVKEGA